MKITPKSNKVGKFQVGGEMPTPEAPVEGGAPVESAAPAEGGQDPILQLAQMAMQALQSQDCQMSMQVCQVFVQMLQQAQGGGAPAPEEPVFRKGGKLDYRIKR